jgi:hypothetical protein
VEKKIFTVTPTLWRGKTLITRGVTPGFRYPRKNNPDRSGLPGEALAKMGRVEQNI